MTASANEEARVPASRSRGDRVALVTGASSGIGRAIAHALSRQVTHVVVNHAHDEAGAEETIALLHAAGAEGVAVAADITDPRQVEAMLTTCRQRFGRIDILVNNAGVSAFKPLSDVSEADFDRLFSINTRGPFFLTKAALPLLADDGRVVNVSSTFASHVPFPGCSVYAGSKAAVEGFTRAWAVELGKRGITVNAVAPGLTDTPLMRRTSPPGTAETVAARSRFGRLGTPEDIAGAVALLCTAQARWITGQTIAVHGGSVA